jgi:acetoin utilization protein AcuC
MTGTATKAFIHSPEIEQYAYPSGCPFSTARAGQARKTLASMGLLAGEDRREVPPVAATRPEVLTFHAEAYLLAIEKAPLGFLDADGLFMGLGTPETPIFHGMFEYALLSVGASLTGARLLLAGEANIAFNPSGGFHHAHAAHASGFCYLNDIVVACEHLTRAGKRVLFVDVDAHHCDGVQDAFYARRDVMTVSFHESGKTLWPGTGFPDEIGEGEGEGYSVNVPLPAGTYDEAFKRAFGEIAPPMIAAFDPDVIVMETGMDCLAGDPLTHMALTNNAYAEAVRTVRDTGKPLLVTGGGGYHVGNSARGYALVWVVLCGEDEQSDDMGLGLGGVMMESSDWMGGLRDRQLVVADAQRAEVDRDVEDTIEKVKRAVFGRHGL